MIRKAEQKDIRAIIEIIKSVHIKNINNKDNGFLASEDLSEISYSRMIRDYEYCYVCEVENNVVGFLIASSKGLMDKGSEIYSFLNTGSSEDFIYIFQIGISPNFQRKGMGALLYKQLFKDARIKKFRVITSKDPLNNASRKLHQKLGFKEISVFRWSDSVESYVYNLELK